MPWQQRPVPTAVLPDAGSVPDGIPTYVVPDIAYHYNKLMVRKFDKAIDILGADHHGYVPRLKAALTALGADAARLDVVLMQMVIVAVSAGTGCCGRTVPVSVLPLPWHAAGCKCGHGHTVHSIPALSMTTGSAKAPCIRMDR